MNRLSKPMSVIGFVVSMVLVSRLLYLLASGDSQRFSEGNHGLWLTVGAMVIASIAGGLVFYFFLAHQDASSKTTGVPVRPGTASVRDVVNVKSTIPEPFDIKRWEKLNPWLIQGQADDRMPMRGAAGDGNGSLSARRSTARRTHQIMFKKWSQTRHD